MSSGADAASLMTYIGSGLTIVAVIPYAIEILKGHTKPRIISWAIWGTLSSVGAAGANSAHQLPAAMFGAFCAAGCFIIVILGLRNRDLTIEKLDAFCFLGALCGFTVLVVLNNPTYAILTSIVIDFIGSMPTLKHAWKHPEEETALCFVLYAAGALLVMFDVNLRVFTSVAYPAYIFAIDTTIAGTLLLKPRHKVVKPKAKPVRLKRQPAPVSLGLTNALMRENSDLWHEIHNHPLQRLITQASIGPEAMAALSQQRIVMYRWDMRTFSLLRDYRRSVIIDQLLHSLATETAHRGRRLSHGITATAGQSRLEEWPASLGYATYVHACAQEGILEGLVAMYTRQLLQLRIYSNLDDNIAPETSHDAATSHTSSATFRTGVFRLSKYINAYAGQPSQLMHAHLARIARNVMRFELAFMDEAVKQTTTRREHRATNSNREASLSRHK